MGLLSGFLGHASEIDEQSLQQEFQQIMIPGERIEKAYKLIRDLIVFTNKRMVIVDKQGMTGKKVEYLSIPYKYIVRFAKESAGHFDLDSELKIWVFGEDRPIVKEFKKDNNIDEIYQLLGQYILE